MSEQSVDVTQILDQHIYRELFDHRIIILADALEQHNANRLCTSLLLLSFRDPTADIVFLINSPGGSVPGMLAIRDCMNGIPNDVITVNLGIQRRTVFVVRRNARQAFLPSPCQGVVAPGFGWNWRRGAGY